MTPSENIGLLRAEELLSGFSRNRRKPKKSLPKSELSALAIGVLANAVELADQGEFHALGFVTDRLLPYIGQHAPPAALATAALQIAQRFREDADVESAASWLQFAAIAHRNLGSVKVATRFAQQAHFELGGGCDTIRSAYALIAVASCKIKESRLKEARYDLERLNAEFPITDDNLCVHAQADLERTKINLAISDGNQARYFADSASDKFKFKLTFNYAHAIVQGYQCAAFVRCGMPGRAYTAGLRSVTTMLHDCEFSSLVNLAGPIQEIMEEGIYNFREERELATSLRDLVHRRNPSIETYEMALRASSKLYIFHLENTAFPEERYENSLELLCRDAIAC